MTLILILIALGGGGYLVWRYKNDLLVLKDKAKNLFKGEK